MASLENPSSYHCILLSWILLLISSSGFEASGSAAVNSSEKVSLGLYYETLCPYCSNFIVNHLVHIFDNGIDSIVDLNLVPYGNAKISPNQNITCQHGPSECLLNTVEACAIDAWPNLSDHFPFINCVETLVYKHKYPQWIQCFEQLGLDSKPIFDCYDSGRGKELELQYAAETKALEPPHTYVPWVVVDGQPLYDDYENFMSYVCKAYKGTDVPEACSKLSIKGIPKKRGNPMNPVCYSEPKLSERIEPVVSSWIPSSSM